MSLPIPNNSNSEATVQKEKSSSEGCLDPKALKVKMEGWSAEDRFNQMLDMLNAATSPPAGWKTSELIHKKYNIGAWSFMEGFLIAGMWFGGFVSGGWLRDRIRKADQDGAIDPLMAQRLLEFIDANKEVLE